MTKKKEEFSISGKGYIETLLRIKKQIKSAQIRATLSVNMELIRLYWDIGKSVSDMQEKYDWGSNFLESLAKDLQQSFPQMAGFSRTNISRMRALYRAYEKCAQAVPKIESLPVFNIPWGHNVVLLQKIKSADLRLWYAEKSVENGWSRAILEMQIESRLHERTGKAITNFTQTLPAPDSDMAQQSLKDPYIFDFLTLHEKAIEREVEQGLIDHIQKFLLELGQGFSFVGRQKHIVVGDSDFYIDLLFYHLKLRCYLVVELKAIPFKPDYVGQLNLYLSAVDDLLRHPDDKPTIGLLLCKTKNDFVAEYALRNLKTPMGVASYKTELVESLPKNLKWSLPTVEEIEAELGKQKIMEGSEE